MNGLKLKLQELVSRCTDTHNMNWRVYKVGTYSCIYIYDQVQKLQLLILGFHGGLFVCVGSVLGLLHSICD